MKGIEKGTVMINALKQDVEKRMRKSMDALNADLAKLRTGRAHPSLLEHIKIDYYGNDTPLSQVASITVSDARTLTISPWEKKLTPVIEKAIQTSGLGLNPATSGDLIRIPLPPLNEERRRELVKLVKAEAENARVSIRGIRRDANNQLKEDLKDKKVTEDDERRGQEQIQKLTDAFIAEVDKVIAAKEKEIMAI